jgi:asparagine synthase (glutamine-hydrolysing)
MDKAAMAVGVETRPPLLDHRIVEFAFGLADRFRIRGTTQKSLLRSTAARWLPRQIVSRPKAPFGAPLRAWIRNDLREMVDDLLSPQAMRARGLYRPEVVRSLIDADRMGRADHAHFVWNLLWRELWFRQFMDGPLDLPEPAGAVVERVVTSLPECAIAATDRWEAQRSLRGE